MTPEPTLTVWLDGSHVHADGQLPQRQDSLDEQLRNVRAIAERMGCHDAADWIRASTTYITGWR